MKSENVWKLNEMRSVKFQRYFRYRNTRPNNLHRTHNFVPLQCRRYRCDMTFLFYYLTRKTEDDMQAKRKLVSLANKV